MLFGPEVWPAILAQEFSVAGYTLLLSLIEYKTLVLRGDMEAANEILPTIPQACRCRFEIPHFSVALLSVLTSSCSLISPALVLFVC